MAGSGYSAQLYYANGAGQSEGALQPLASSVTSFRTSATLAGTIAPSFQSLPGVPVGGSATLQLRVWSNLGGTVTSWAQAESLWVVQTPGMIAGKSILFDITGLADNTSPAPAEMTGFRSFNLYGAIVPEPPVLVLAGLAGVGLLIFRRRTN